MLKAMLLPYLHAHTGLGCGAADLCLYTGAACMNVPEQDVDDQLRPARPSAARVRLSVQRLSCRLTRPACI